MSVMVIQKVKGNTNKQSAIIKLLVARGKRLVSAKPGKIQQESMHTGSAHIAKDLYSLEVASIGKESRWKHRADKIVTSIETKHRHQRDSGTRSARIRVE